jgi:cystathionine beta-lyase/cystathionine gamma-synthase
MSTPTDNLRQATGARPDKHDYATLNEHSWFVHGGNRADDTTGAIRTPIVMANSYLLPEDPASIEDTDYAGLVYTREQGANQRGLEQKLAHLDHGEAAAVFGTGMAALSAAFVTLLGPGDHAIVSNVVYTRSWGLFASLLPKKLGVEVDFVDITDLDAVRAALRPSTRLIHTEVIANPDLRVADITALADIAHDAGARLTVDSTFTPPPLLRPLDLGADLTVHSLTKYVNGHGDAMGGSVTGATELVEAIRTGALHHIGGAISPFNAWLIMRGSVTLPLRLERQCQTSQQIAESLASDPRIAHVAYPGAARGPEAPARRRPTARRLRRRGRLRHRRHPPRPRPVRQRPAGDHLSRLPRPRRDPHRLRAVPRGPRRCLRRAIQETRTDPTRRRPGVRPRPHHRPRRRTHHRLRRAPMTGSGRDPDPPLAIPAHTTGPGARRHWPARRKQR